MVSLLTRPDRLWGLRQMMTAPRDRAQSRQTWQALERWISTHSGLDYDTDLRPWLGDEVTFAVTSADLDHSADNGQQPGYLLVLTSRQGLQAREAAHLFWQNRVVAGDELIFEPLSGTTLIYNDFSGQANAAARSSDPRQFASAIVGDRYVLLANDPQVVRQAIAAFQAPDISLAKAPQYQELVEQLPPGRIAWVYSRLDTTLDWLGVASQQPQATLASAQKLLLSWRLTPQGIIADTALVAAPGSDFTPYPATLNQSVSAANWLPPESVMVAGSDNVTTLLQTFLEGIGRYEWVQAAIQPAVSALSLGTEADLVDAAALWAGNKGDYALGRLEGQMPAWIFVAKTPRAQAQTDELDSQAQRHGLGVSQVELGDHVVTAWTRLSAKSERLGDLPKIKTDVVAVHTQIDAYEIFATSLAALQKAVDAPKQHVSGQQSDFQSVLALSQYPNAGFIYLDWPQIIPLLEQQWAWFRVLEKVSQPITTHIQSIVLNPSGGNRVVRRGELTFTLKAS
jgi:hypothetical protein